MKKQIVQGGSITLTGVVLLGLLLPTPAAAIFGFGDIVFDPTTYGELATIATSQASTLEKMIEEYNQIVKIYTTNQQMYAQAKAMAQRISHPQRLRWMTLAQQSINDYTRNVYGETIHWPTMINGQPQWAGPAWTAATVAVQPNPELGQETAGSSSGLANLASVEAVDGSATQCLATVAQYRSNLTTNQSATTQLQTAAIDDSDDTNSEIQQLNLLNAAQAQAANEQRAQGAIQACLVEQQALTNKMQRDALAGHLNFYTEVRRYTTTEGGAWTGASQALSTY